MRWDIFCRVIDNHGDLGVCWRLASDLAARGHAVRLVVDDARALAWMAPSGAPGVTVHAWSDDPYNGPSNGLNDNAIDNANNNANDDAISLAQGTAGGSTRDTWAVGDVVVEAFGCDPPAAYVAAMALRSVPPVWINLEYLSAEGYVERSHALPSPQRNGLTKWFFYPGFTAGTGGLLREPGLLARHQALHDPAWLASRGWAPRAGERVISLFCYTQPRLEAWLHMLAKRPTLLLVTPGFATQQVQGLSLPQSLRVLQLPWLTQPDYDLLLRACDLNVVRGEDSFVRAHWAGQPLLWHIYPQHDGAHAAKLAAWLDTHLRGAPAALAGQVRALHLHWNGLTGAADSPDDGTGAAPDLPDLRAWRHWQHQRCQELARQDDLVTQLLRFVDSRPRAAP